MPFLGARGRLDGGRPACRLAPRASAPGPRAAHSRSLGTGTVEEGVCPGWGLVSIRATSVFPWKWCYLGKQVGVSPRPGGDLRLGSSALRLPSPPPHFAPRAESPPGGGAGAWVAVKGGGGWPSVGRSPPGGQSRLLKSLCREGALAPNPGGPRGGETIGLIHIQNLEAGGDSLLRKLMQAS